MNRVRQILVFLMVLMLSGWSSTGVMAQQTGQWVSLGPAPSRMSVLNNWANVEGMTKDGNPCVGAMNIVLEDPAHAGVLYVGTANGGVWKSVNGGSSWTPLTDRLSSLSIGGMTFDRSNPSNLYIGFGKQSNYSESGGPLNSIKLSTDGGTTWTSPDTNNVLVGRDVTRMLADGNNILVGIKNPGKDEKGFYRETGLYRTTNGGADFAMVKTASGLAAGIVDDLKYDPGYNGTSNRSVYAAVRNSDASAGVYKSDDSGATWKRLSTIPTAGAATERILLSTTGNVIAAMVVNGTEAAATTIYRSIDGGATWTSMAQPVTQDYDPVNKLNQQGLFPGGQYNNAALYIDPSNPNIVYVSGDRQPGDLNGTNANSIGAKQYSGRIFRGIYDPKTGQTTWEPLTHSGTLSNSSPHADSRSIFIDSTGRLIQTDDGGIYARSNPQGKGDWTSMNGNIAVSEVDSASWNPLANRAVIGMQDNGSAYQIIAGGTWGSINGGDGGTNAVNFQTYASSGTAVIYASYQYLGGLLRFRMDSKGDPITASKTSLGPYINEGGVKTYLRENTSLVPFYPTLTLNRTDQTRIAIGGLGLFIGQDDPTVEVSDPKQYEIAMSQLVTPKQIADTGIYNAGFGTVVYGALDRPGAIAAGLGNAMVGDRSAASMESDKYYGQIWYSDDAETTAAVRLTNVEMAGGKRTYYIQTVVFDGKTGSKNLYATDAFRVLRGTRNSDATLYDFDDIGSTLPANFIYRRALEYVSFNGVNALLAGGAHSTTTDTDVNPLYYTVDPATYNGATWTALGKLLPNAPVMYLHYSDLDDVLLVATLGRGVFAMYDLTTLFPQATTLTFGKGDNDSFPGAELLTDGTPAGGGASFSRPLIKTGAGTLTLPNAAATYTGGTQFNGGIIAAYQDASFGPAGNWTFNGGELKYLASFNSSRTITLQAGGGTFDTNGFNSTLSGIISGSGALTKNGGGVLTLTKDNTYTGDTTINAGTLEVNNPNKVTGSGTGTGNVTVGEAGILSGTGRVAGNVYNYGRQNPGNSVGKLTIGGTYFQKSSGVLDIEISSTENDVLEVEGNVSLNGALKTILLNGYRPDLGDSFTIVTAKGVSGHFSSLDTAINAAGTLYFKPKYSLNQVDIVLERDYAFNLQKRGFSSNQQSVGMMLNSVANTAAGHSGDLDTVLSAIDNLATDSQLAAALDQIAPRGDLTQAVMSYNGATMQTGNITGRLSDLRAGATGINLQNLSLKLEQDETLNRYGKPIVLAFNSEGLPPVEVFKTDISRNLGFFIRGNGTFGELKTDSTNSFQNYGITFGGDYRFSPTFVAGIMGGYNRGKSDLDAIGSSATATTFSVGAYGTYYHGGFYLDGQVNYGWDNVSKDRRIVFPGINRTAASDQKGRLLTFAGGAGYDIPVQNWILTPMFSTEYVRLATEDYTESGADALNLTVAGQSTKLLQGHAGGSVAYVWKTDRMTLTPRVWALYGHEFDRDDQAVVTARLAMGGSSFTTAVASPDRDFVTLGAQAVLTLPPDKSLYVSFSGQIGQSNYANYNIGGGFRITF